MNVFIAPPSPTAPSLELEAALGEENPGNSLRKVMESGDISGKSRPIKKEIFDYQFDHLALAILHCNFVIVDI